METARSRPRGVILEEVLTYDPTYLTSDEGECSLFISRYRVVRKPKSGLVVKRYKTVEAFATEEEMLRAISWRQMEEESGDLPQKIIVACERGL